MQPEKKIDLSKIDEALAKRLQAKLEEEGKRPDSEQASGDWPEPFRASGAKHAVG